jgi:hypothetical protein
MKCGNNVVIIQIEYFNSESARFTQGIYPPT